MASISQYRNGWRAQIYVGGVRESACFDKKFEAEAWADRRETELRTLKKAVDNARRIATNKHKFLESSGIYSEEELVATSIPMPESSGVYFLIKNEVVVYVGQSLNVHARIRQHLATKCFDRVNIIACEPGDLNRLESLYIKKLQPVLNVVGKSGVDQFDLEEELLCQAS